MEDQQSEPSSTCDSSGNVSMRKQEEPTLMCLRNLPLDLDVGSFCNILSLSGHPGVAAFTKPSEKSYGFVLFHNKESAERALYQFPALSKINGLTPKLQIAQPPEDSSDTDFSLEEAHVHLDETFLVLSRIRQLLPCVSLSDDKTTEEQLDALFSEAAFTLKIARFILLALHRQSGPMTEHTEDDHASSSSSSRFNVNDVCLSRFWMEDPQSGPTATCNSRGNLSNKKQDEPTVMCIRNLPLDLDVGSFCNKLSLSGQPGVAAFTKPNEKSYGFVLFHNKESAERALYQFPVLSEFNGLTPELQIAQSLDESSDTDFPLEEAHVHLDEAYLILSQIMQLLPHVGHIYDNTTEDELDALFSEAAFTLKITRFILLALQRQLGQMAEQVEDDHPSSSSSSRFNVDDGSVSSFCDPGSASFLVAPTQGDFASTSGNAAKVVDSERGKSKNLGKAAELISDSSGQDTELNEELSCGNADGSSLRCAQLKTKSGNPSPNNSTNRKAYQPAEYFENLDHKNGMHCSGSESGAKQE